VQVVKIEGIGAISLFEWWRRPPENRCPPYRTKTNFHHVARLVPFDSTGYELSKTLPFARWGGVEVENELIKDVAKSSPKEIFEITFLHNHSSP
jgi:hypothetical protein